MTDDKAYWSRLDELARAEAAAALGDKKPCPLLDRILAAAPPPPAGISRDDAKKRARDVVMIELRRLFP